MSYMPRRSFIKAALAAPALSAMAAAQTDPPVSVDTATAPASGMPFGRIGGLNISRLMLGGNLLTHFTHSRDLKYVYNLTAHYNTDDKIIETLALAERHGINTLVVHTVPHVIALLARYRKELGGKMQWIICPTTQIDSDKDAYISQVKELVSEKCEAIYLWGVTSDRLVAQGKISAMADAVKIAHDHGVPSGMSAHDLRVITDCEEHGVGADFYIKTYHHHRYPSGPKPEELIGPYAEHPGYWCREPEETAKVMRQVEKPWIAFKVMAAGAIPPSDAFHYAFENGADHILAGMFDFEISENVEISKDAVAIAAQRERPWHS